MSDIHSLPGVTEAKAKSVIRQHRKASFYVKKYLMIFVGALIAAIGLELFLIPNNVIDGGVVGISIMMSSITGLSLGVFLVLLNIPFLYLGYKQIGKNFAIATTIAICILSVWSAVFAPLPKVTDDPFLAAIFGGIIDGLGVGLIIRAGGSLDGTEIVAIIMDRKSVFSVGEVVMFINLFILSSAGLLYGWGQGDVLARRLLRHLEDDRRRHQGPRRVVRRHDRHE